MHPAIHKNASQAHAQGGLGPLMRYWRGMRGKSQLDVSLDTGISQRHISFIESGRSTPSRQTLLDIAQALDVPFRERNALLQSAGYAAMYSESPLEALETQGLRKALHRILNQHAPFPAVVMDRYWNVLLANDFSSRFFNHFVDMSARTSPRNMLHLMFDPDGMRPFIVDWEQTARSLIERVHRESVGRAIDDKTNELLRSLHAYPNAGREWTARSPAVGPPHSPVITLSFAKDEVVMNYFSMITTVGTPQTISAQELRIESMFPADDATEMRHIQMLGH